MKTPNFTRLRLLTAAVAALSAGCGGPVSGDGQVVVANDTEARTVTAYAALAPAPGASASSPTTSKRLITCANVKNPDTNLSEGKTQPTWDSIRSQWTTADAEARAAMLVAVTDAVNTDANEGRESSDAVRVAAITFITANAPIETNPMVVEKMLPTLANMERHEAQPALLAIMSNRALTSEVRATAAEVLIDNGWSTSSIVKQWFAHTAQSREELDSLLDAMREAGLP